MSSSFFKALPPLGSRHVIRAAVLMVVIFSLLLSYVYFDLPIPTKIRTNIPQETTSEGSESPSPPSGPHVEFVVASLKGDDTSWLGEFIPQWKANIYVVNDKTAPLTVPENKGHEAMVYLTHIINNYDNLPDILVFLHSLRYQWHNDDPLYDGVPLMQSLQTDNILSEGYANLRCVWSLGCPAEIRPEEDNKRPPNDQAGQTQEVYADAFLELFPSEPVPEAVGVACCAQFAATRDRIRARPVDDYHRYRDWILNTTLEDSISGRVMEYSWHMIFGQQPVHCPDVRTCYCKTYGLCNLTSCDDYRCGERWHFPPSASLPQGWPEYGWEGEHRTPEELQEIRYEAMDRSPASSSTAAPEPVATAVESPTG